ncbi:Thiaminase-2 [compost metagenome]
MTSKFCDRLDEWALKSTDEELARMREHFLLSCQLEYMFWDMAFNLEEWPVSVTVNL